MKTAKAVARVASQAVGAIAVLVFFGAPMSSGAAWWLMGGSIIVGIICLVAYMWSEPDEDEPLSKISS